MLHMPLPGAAMRCLIACLAVAAMLFTAAPVAGAQEPDLVVEIVGPRIADAGSDVGEHIRITVANVGRGLARGTETVGQDGYMVDVFLTRAAIPSGFASFSPNYSDGVLLREGRVSNTVDLRFGERHDYRAGGGIPGDTPPGIVRRVTDATQWQQITDERAQDLLIYLALSRFDGRPSYSRLPRELQLDVKSFFATYSKACAQADALLLSLGEPGTVDAACQASEVGKLMPNALYVHESALEHLSPTLRLFEGCARGYIGRVEGANIIKLHRHEPKVSYLTYPDFETDPHPALAHSLTVHFQTFRLRSRNYRPYRNPPILHRKETFLHPDHLLRAKFARLSRIEEKHGLYDDPAQIGTKDGWGHTLARYGLELRGHRLLRCR